MPSQAEIWCINSYIKNISTLISHISWLSLDYDPVLHRNVSNNAQPSILFYYISGNQFRLSPVLILPPLISHHHS